MSWAHFAGSLHQPWNLPFLQGALASSIGKCYLEAKIWVLCVLLRQSFEDLSVNRTFTPFTPTFISLSVYIYRSPLVHTNISNSYLTPQVHPCLYLSSVTVWNIIESTLSVFNYFYQLHGKDPIVHLSAYLLPYMDAHLTYSGSRISGPEAPWCGCRPPHPTWSLTPMPLQVHTIHTHAFSRCITLSAPQCVHQTRCSLNPFL